MPRRYTALANNEIYHILNRGVAKMPIFSVPTEYQRFLNLINFYRYKNLPLSFSHYVRLSLPEKEKLSETLSQKGKLVEIFAYCLMPNHFHLLIRQNQDHGIPQMLSNLQNAYVRFFNLRQERRGPLFESSFKAIRIEDDEQFLHVSRYIHLNPCSSYLIEAQNLSFYPWSSFSKYLGKKPPEFVKTDMVLNLAGGKEKYEEFVMNQAAYQRELNKIKHLSLENP